MARIPRTIRWKTLSNFKEEGKTFHFAVCLDTYHLLNSGVEVPKIQICVVLRGDAVKDGCDSCAVFGEQGSSASHMTAAKVLDVVSSFTLTPTWTWRTLKIFWACHNKNAQLFGLRLQRSRCPTSWSKHSRSGGTTWRTFLRTSIGRITLGTTIRNIHTRRKLGESTWMGILIFAPREGFIALWLCGRHKKKCREEGKLKFLWTKLKDKRGPYRTYFSTARRHTLDVRNGSAKLTKGSFRNIENCKNPSLPAGTVKPLPGWKRSPSDTIS